MTNQFEFRFIRPSEADEAGDIEQICFPPNEACTRERIRIRVNTCPEVFMVAVDKNTGVIAGFVNGIATHETKFRDEFFMDIGTHDPQGKRVMILGVDVRPEYRLQGLARAMMKRFAEIGREAGRDAIYLTCLESKVSMYEKFGYEDLGMADSEWGGEAWHEMVLKL